MQGFLRRLRKVAAELVEAQESENPDAGLIGQLQNKLSLTQTEYTYSLEHIPLGSGGGTER